ncbi:MAG: copper chaperone PCu(A)C [Ilumatobacter sp.]|uniref:copper chaperone PCu(A)C n=1 Tax=Ilumatobacter sp. TaxID=1967498 RepID=UPI0026202BA2|nr:copper chaperone PCu(A)C [Ilumatobacter sp.]MDJ0767576.1 copper chaperone PCu(A)C [Ilumatobacter sp.]
MHPGRRRPTMLLAAALASGACGSSSDAPTARDGEIAAEVGGFVVRDVWTRPTPPGSDEAAIYLTIENRDAPDDRFVGSVSDRCMAMHPHLTTIDDDGVASMTDAGEDRLAVPAGGSLVMAPTALHVMCLGLTGPLEAGDTFGIELRFAEHEPVVVEVDVEQR